MCPMVGGDVFVDQHMDMNTNFTTLADDTISFHKLAIDDGSHTDPGKKQQRIFFMARLLQFRRFTKNFPKAWLTATTMAFTRAL